MPTILNNLIHLANQADNAGSPEEASKQWRNVLDFAEYTPLVLKEPLTPYILAYAFYSLVKVEPDALLKAKAYIHLAVTLHDLDEPIVFKPLATSHQQLMQKIIQLKNKLHPVLLTKA